MFSNRKGDLFTFEVTRASVGEVSFRGREGERFRVTFATNLVNGPHGIEATVQGTGPVDIEAFEVFQPPLLD